MRTLDVYEYDTPPLRPDLVGAAAFMTCLDDNRVYFVIHKEQNEVDIEFVDKER